MKKLQPNIILESVERICNWLEQLFSFLSITFLLIPISFAETTTGVENTTRGILPPAYEYPIPENENCETLPVGQSRVVNLQEREAPTRISSRYAVSRVSADVYRIDLRLNFRIRGSARIDPQLAARHVSERLIMPTTDIISQRYERIVQQCLDEMQPRLRSPDGIQLRININSTSAPQRAPTTHIDIYGQENTNQVNSHAWRIDTSCAVIVHEIFHLLGLPDGYFANRLNSEDLNRLHNTCVNREQFGSCRHIEPDGIMNNYESALGIETYHILVCQPEQATQAQREHRQVNEMPLSCPQGFSVWGRTRMSQDFSWIRRSQNANYQDGWIVFYKRYRPTSTWALRNAHTRYIINPECVSSNRRYLTCVQNSRRTGDCLTTPPYCNFDFTD